MGIFDFAKEMGRKIDAQMDLAKEISDSGIEVRDLKADFDNGIAKIYGKVNSNADREKIILLTGNISGVEKVEDFLDIETSEKDSKFYTVKSGDSLSKIAKEFYGNAMKYNVIFEANKPMLKNPDKIYPGQVLRIPKID